jgi:hypothetical protein
VGLRAFKRGGQQGTSRCNGRLFAEQRVIGNGMKAEIARRKKQFLLIIAQHQVHRQRIVDLRQTEPQHISHLLTRFGSDQQ